MQHNKNTDVIKANTRLLLLRSLHEMAGYESNESILDDSLDHWGLRISRDVIRTELYWLSEQGLVTLRDIDGYLIARLTGRGGDVATGQAMVPGVKRPRA